MEEYLSLNLKNDTYDNISNYLNYYKKFYNIDDKIKNYYQKLKNSEDLNGTFSIYDKRLKLKIKVDFFKNMN